MLHSLLPLNASEERLVAHAASGEQVRLANDQPSIRGELIRRLQLGLPLDGQTFSPVVKVAATGLWIDGATVDGVIDLAESPGADGTGQLPLRLENSRLNGDQHPPEGTRSETRPALDLSHARIARLSLHGSCFAWVDLSDTEIRGDLDLRGAGPLTPTGICHVKARDAPILGNVKADRVLCRAPPVEMHANTQRSVFALDFSGARIDGSMFLMAPRLIEGCLRLMNATIGGDLRIVGGELIGQRTDFGEHPAIELQTAVVNGNVMIAALLEHGPQHVHRRVSPPRIVGGIGMYGCHVSGAVNFSGVALLAGEPRRGAWHAINATTCRIGGNLIVDAFAEKEGDILIPATIGPGGEMLFGGASVGGDLNLFVRHSPKEPDTGLTASADNETTPKLDLDTASIDGKVEIHDFPGDISVTGSKVGSDCTIYCHRGPGSKHDPHEVSADGISIEGKFTVHLAHTKLSLAHANVGGPATIESQLDDALHYPRLSSPEVDLSFAQFRSDLTFVPMVDVAILRRLRVTGSLRLSPVRNEAQGRHEAEMRSVGVPSEIRHRQALPWLDFEDAVVSGSLVIESMSPPGDDPHGAALRSDIEVRAGWSRPLDCLPGWTLHELACRSKKHGVQTLAVLLNDRPAGHVPASEASLILDGNSARIYRAVKLTQKARTSQPRGASAADTQPAPEVKPLLSEERAVREYLRLFTTYVFSTDAYFYIVESEAEAAWVLSWLDRKTVAGKIGEAEVRRESPQDGSGAPGWHVTACLLYLNALYRVEFKVQDDGQVTMLADEELCRTPSLAAVGTYPFRRFFRRRAPDGRDWSVPLPYASDDGWDRLPAPAHSSVLEAVRPAPGHRDDTETTHDTDTMPVVSLRGAHVGTLDDQQGRGWFFGGDLAQGSPLRLELDGLLFQSQGDSLPDGGRARRPTESFQGDGATGSGSVAGLERARKEWLKLQFPESDATPRRVPQKDLFSPQPWEQLAKVLREQGNVRESRAILLDRLGTERQVDLRKPVADWLELLRKEAERWREFKPAPSAPESASPLRTRWTPWISFGIARGRDLPHGLATLTKRTANVLLEGLRWSGRWLLEKCFGYGLSRARALSTCAFFVLIVGWHAVEIANSGRLYFFPFGERAFLPSRSWAVLSSPALVVDSAPVSAVALQAGDDKAMAPATPVLESRDRAVEEVTCGNLIEPLLYAIDVFVPLLDLRQESRCTVSSHPDAALWRFFKSLYAIVGWVVISMTVLTITGVLRRDVER